MLKNNTEFELILNAEFKKGDVLKCQNLPIKAEVIETPTPHYARWYWRLLNKLTFGRCFNVSYTYKVKTIDGF